MVELGAFRYARDVRNARLSCAPAREAVVSWNARASEGTLRFRLLYADGSTSAWYPYAQWSPHERRSFSTHDAAAGLDIRVDVIAAEDAFDGLELDADGIDFALLALSTPVEHTPSVAYPNHARVLDVPQRSQYVREEERGWCSAASLAMLMAFWGVDLDVATVADGVLDRAYNGTGNWSFNAAFAGAHGLAAVVAHLRNLDHAARFVERGVPLALSYAWNADELPHAPVEHSAGHLAVLCGFNAEGDCVMNDPAAPQVRAIYPRRAIETLWQRSGGVAYVVAATPDAFVDLMHA